MQISFSFPLFLPLPPSASCFPESKPPVKLKKTSLPEHNNSEAPRTKHCDIIGKEHKITYSIFFILLRFTQKNNLTTIASEAWQSILSSPPNRTTSSDFFYVSPWKKQANHYPLTVNKPIKFKKNEQKERDKRWICRNAGNSLCNSCYAHAPKSKIWLQPWRRARSPRMEDPDQEKRPQACFGERSRLL